MSKAQKLGFYATPPHECNYLPGREAVTLFADPHFPKNSRLYAALADCGFRRSGEHLYVPHCSGCIKCIPVRIPVAEFTPTRNQLRTSKRNRDLSIFRVPADFNAEHFQLYRNYLQQRHLGGGMDNPTESNYMEFLTSSWSDTCFYEMRRDGRLLCVAVVDFMDDAISAVYTFFDTSCSRDSLGKYAILFELEEAKRLDLNWLYLGYWIKGCGKMEYKNEYRPLEYFVNNVWTRNPPPLI